MTNCPKCGRPEVESMTPRTVYACGSSDYDQRPGTFKQGEQCSQPPAPSEEMEERIKRIADDVAQRNTSTVEAHYLVEDSAIEAMESLAAELGKEREGEVATLRAELADRWRDITANEQQTQRLLNDIENLRAEIAELKARP